MARPSDATASSPPSPPSPLAAPSPRVLDLFAVPDDAVWLAKRSFRAGDLVLSPDRDPGVAAWLSPLLARLAVRLDEEGASGLRVAVPVPARDGSWVVEGWGASRFEPGTGPCRDLGVTLAAGRLLHARLAAAVPTRPDGLETRRGERARAERLAFGPLHALSEALAGSGLQELTDELACAGDEDAPSQLVHTDLAGNVLLDARGAAVVIGLSPAWRPTLWAEAVCVLDSVVWLDAPERALVEWGANERRQAMLRAIAFCALADGDPTPYARALALL